MKKRLIAAALAVAIMACFCLAVAAGTAGSASDPLISLSYLTDTFRSALLTETRNAAETSLQTVYDRAVAQLPETEVSPYSHADPAIELRLKSGDTVTGVTGTLYTPLAGSAVITYRGSAVIDVTEGTVVSSGAAVTAMHRYLVAEDTSAVFSVTQDTAVIQVQNDYLRTTSAATDYNALADALFDLGLFRGTGGSYGRGFELERPATRLEGLIMFIRLLGEEEAALNSTASLPFTDVPAWAKAYVAYAYEQGYTKGVSATLFDPASTLTGQQYVTFILRALRYEEDTDFTWPTALDDAVALGVLTGGERTLAAAADFCRSRVAYLSFFSLFSTVKGTGQTVFQRLRDAGAFQVDAATADSIIAAVRVTRVR